jgi:hypothetical protein
VKPNAAAPAKSRLDPTKGKGKAKREYPSDGEEERLEFGRLTKPTKRLRPSPPSEGLALPGSFFAPSPLADPPLIPYLPVSDSEEDWDEVAAAEPTSSLPLLNDVYVEEGGGDDMEEIDVNAFEAEMNETLEEDDEDFLAAAVESELDPPPDRPASLSQFTGGEPSQDEDDFSSSDESDDE